MASLCLQTKAMREQTKEVQQRCVQVQRHATETSNACEAPGPLILRLHHRLKRFLHDGLDIKKIICWILKMRPRGKLLVRWIYFLKCLK